MVVEDFKRGTNDDMRLKDIFERPSNVAGRSELTSEKILAGFGKNHKRI